MRTQVENLIRDSLAKNLDFIEPGLKLIAKNYLLRNRDGANGYIDILARDSAGLFTIIELKRSDSSAREAMHEVAKYVELLARDKGISRSRVRAMVVSTTWHELLVPFSYYSSTSEFPFDGYSLEVAADGISIIGARHVEPLKAPAERTLTWHQRLITLEGGTDGPAIWSQIKRFLSKFGVRDFVGLQLAHDSSMQSLVLALGTIYDLSTREALLEFVVEESEIYEVEDVADEPTESLVLMAIAYELDSLDFGLCYPEKVNSLVFLHGWEQIAWYREGVFDSSELFPDDELLGMVQGWSGLGQSTYRGRARPQNSAQWKEFRHGVDVALALNLECESLVTAWLEEIGPSTGEYDVAAQIYNPSDLIGTLVHGLDRPEFDRLIPKIQLGIDAPGDKGRMLEGILTWNGKQVDIERSFRKVFKEDVDWSTYRSTGFIWEQDPLLLRVWNLKYSFFEFRIGQKFPMMLSLDNDRIRRISCREDFLGRFIAPDASPFPEFLDAHSTSLRRLVKRLRDQLIIFPDSATQMFISKRSDLSDGLD